eukprot:gb/GEZN01009015.1/.p1 GENE.gb/GEZN01009015.1/~~gb/GEZN01009015.1/.p1  ORF type:complete len:293 (+),score=45.38 gb/GEZN01009015.1/:28-906(+)
MSRPCFLLLAVCALALFGSLTQAFDTAKKPGPATAQKPKAKRVKKPQAEVVVDGVEKKKAQPPQQPQPQQTSQSLLKLFELEHAPGGITTEGGGFISRGQVEVTYSASTTGRSFSSGAASKLGVVRVKAGPPWSDDEKNAFEDLVSRNGFYSIRLTPLVAENASDTVSRTPVMASVRACSLLASGFREILTLNIDPYGNVLALNYATPIKTCPAEQKGIQSLQASQLLAKDISFQTLGKISLGRPSVPVSLVKSMQEKKEEAEAAANQNGSFVSRYWPYMAAFAVFMLVTGK